MYHHVKMLHPMVFFFPFLRLVSQSVGSQSPLAYPIINTLSSTPSHVVTLIPSAAQLELPTVRSILDYQLSQILCAR